MLRAFVFSIQQRSKRRRLRRMAAAPCDQAHSTSNLRFVARRLHQLRIFKPVASAAFLSRRRPPLTLAPSPPQRAARLLPMIQAGTGSVLNARLGVDVWSNASYMDVATSRTKQTAEQHFAHV